MGHDKPPNLLEVLGSEPLFMDEPIPRSSWPNELSWLFEPRLGKRSVDNQRRGRFWEALCRGHCITTAIVFVRQPFSTLAQA
jgi:hypothetical protein